MKTNYCCYLNIPFIMIWSKLFIIIKLNKSKFCCPSLTSIYWEQVSEVTVSIPSAVIKYRQKNTIFKAGIILYECYKC